MELKAKSIRAFIGAKDFDKSRQFYNELGFEEVVIDKSMSLFRVNEQLSFYLQNAYVKKWVDNSMLFLEVDDPEACRVLFLSKILVEKYKLVRISEVRYETWGSEFFMHDPSGVLWHVGKFN